MSIDPKLQWCRCGYHWKPSVYQKIVMLVRGEYVRTCPRCQSKMTLRLVNYVVCVKREECVDKMIWRNG